VIDEPVLKLARITKAGVREAADAIAALTSSDPDRAVPLIETFLAACHEKGEEVDDSSGSSASSWASSLNRLVTEGELKPKPTFSQRARARWQRLSGDSS